MMRNITFFSTSRWRTTAPMEKADKLTVAIFLCFYKNDLFFVFLITSKKCEFRVSISFQNDMKNIKKGEFVFVCFVCKTIVLKNTGTLITHK